jgi:hypothetical protein
MLEHIPTVDEKSVRRFALPADGDVPGVQLTGGRHGSGDSCHDHGVRLNRRRWNDSGLNGQEVRVAPAIEGERRHRGGRDHLAELRRHRFDPNLIGSDRDQFALFADLQHHIDLKGGVGIHHEASSSMRLEAVNLNQKLVSADR